MKSKTFVITFSLIFYSLLLILLVGLSLDFNYKDSLYQLKEYLK